mgnify:CR=1 FL=1
MHSLSRNVSSIRSQPFDVNKAFRLYFCSIDVLQQNDGATSVSINSMNIIKVPDSRP